ncbi:MAG: alpha/beta hydrolase, partial [Acidobacteriota bacterium]
SVKDQGATLEGRFAFANEIVHLHFRIIDNYVYGADPAPSLRNLPYGPNIRQRLDVYLAKSSTLTPVAVYFHGGAWLRGDKSDLRGHHRFLDAGISVIAVDYRYIPSENPDATTHDMARAIQFIRHHASTWNLDPHRLGVWGVSAGACTSLWLGTHPDLADPTSPDPISRQSTRPTCVSAIAPQTSLDPIQMRAWVGPQLIYGPHAFALKSFAAFLAQRDQLRPWINAYSPAALLTKTSAPIFLDYLNFGLQPYDPASGYYTHSPRFGIGFLELAKKRNAECYLHYEGHEADRYTSWHQFLIEKLRN